MSKSSSLIDIEAHRIARLHTELDHRTKVTPAMLHSINKDGHLISVSDAWLAKLGYAREEVIGRSSAEFLTPASRIYAIREVLPAFFLSGRIDNVEYQMVCKDGRVIDVLLSAVLDKSVPEMEGVSLAVITDVTAFKAAEQQLVLSEARYRELVESQSELVSLASPEGELRFVNHAYARHYGLQPHDMEGRNLFDFIPEDSRAAVADHLRKVCSVNHSVENENQVVLPDGQIRWMAWTNRALFDTQGQVTAVHSVGRDINDRVVAERRLQQSEARYRLLADHSTDMVFQLDGDLVRRYVSPSCRDILGYEPEELIGEKPMSMAHPEDAPSVKLAFQSMLEGRVDRHSIINRIRHRDGHWIWVEAYFKTLKDPQTGKASGIIGTLRDVSARKAIEDQLQDANRRLQALAEEDALTGLANRRYFDEALLREHACARRERKSLGLLMIDVDRFKSFNDRYGHPAGDECLKRIGRAIRDTIRRAGDVAARYGGEEFAVLLPGIDGSETASVAERIRLAVLELAIEHEASPDRVATISVGANSLTGDSSSGPEAFLREADRALYKAKERGRNTVVIARS
ncbi:sensor domain-containing diguanylate cyclase [Rhizobium leguminosarum]|uniref:sensor domain-containing diguanylate cyclase n=1 Tax=Rhizobium leguminosarum TaxID=384 RepID=UPI000483F2EF|nr:GGDEF domain-containing protein [Rhizobium leguminosarum]